MTIKEDQMPSGCENNTDGREVGSPVTSEVSIAAAIEGDTGRPAKPRVDAISESRCYIDSAARLPAMASMIASAPLHEGVLQQIAVLAQEAVIILECLLALTILIAVTSVVHAWISYTGMKRIAVRQAQLLPAVRSGLRSPVVSSFDPDALEPLVPGFGGTPCTITRGRSLRIGLFAPSLDEEQVLIVARSIEPVDTPVKLYLRINKEGYGWRRWVPPKSWNSFQLEFDGVEPHRVVVSQ